jgi:hypothetical protein
MRAKPAQPLRRRPVGASGPRDPAALRGRWIELRAVADGAYLLFIWKPSGYELREASGELPAVGSEVDADDRKLQVTKIAPSPLPNDARPCVYLQSL